MASKAVRISSRPFITLTAGEKTARQFIGKLSELPATTIIVDNGSNHEILAGLTERTVISLQCALQATLRNSLNIGPDKEVAFLAFAEHHVTGFTSVNGQPTPFRFTWRDATKIRHYVPPILQPLNSNHSSIISCTKSFQRALPRVEVIGLWSTTPLGLTQQNLDGIETPCVVMSHLADLEGALLLAG